MDETKVTYILLLRGVYPDEFIQDVVVETAACLRTSTDIYSDIPARFNGVKNHPTNTNLKCWNCDLSFTTYPKFIPTNLERLGADDHLECDILGNFHSWNCAVSYALTYLPDVHGDILNAISIVEFEFSGKFKEKIPPAPAKTLMKAYCGNNGITQSEYCERVENTKNIGLYSSARI